MPENIEVQENFEMAEEEKKSKTEGPKKIGFFIENVLYFMTIALMAILVFFLFQSRIEGQNPSIGSYQMYIVESGSMVPSLDIGSLIIIREIEPEKLKVGDIITYGGEESQKTVTHRIVEICKGERLSFITRGDANDVNDPLPVRGEAVVGKVIFDIPFLGFLMHFLRTKNGFFLLVLLPAGIIIFSQLFKLYKLLDKPR